MFIFLSITVLFCSIDFSLSFLFHIPICRCSFQRYFLYLHTKKGFQTKIFWMLSNSSSNISWKWDFSMLGIRVIYCLMQFEDRTCYSPLCINRKKKKWDKIETNNIHSQIKKKHWGLTWIAFFFLIKFTKFWYQYPSFIHFTTVLIVFNSFFSVIVFLNLYFVNPHM